MEKKLVGKISHFFPKISVAVIELSGTLKVGDQISIEGASTNFTQAIESMQIEHKQVQSAGAKKSIGLKVQDRVREGDSVFKIAA